jgi:hypothetical protein
MTPLLFEDYARHTIRDRMGEAEREALAALYRSGQAQHRPTTAPFALGARLRLADGLRSLARRLDPGAAVANDHYLVIARSR